MEQEQRLTMARSRAGRSCRAPSCGGIPSTSFPETPRSRNEMEERTGVAAPTEEERMPPCAFSWPAPWWVLLVSACAGTCRSKTPGRQQLCLEVLGLLEIPIKHPLIQALFSTKLKQELTQKTSALLHAASFTSESSANRGLPLGPAPAGWGRGHGGTTTSPLPAAPLPQDGTCRLHFLPLVPSCTLTSRSLGAGARTCQSTCFPMVAQLI